MPISKWNQRTFHRTLYAGAGMLQTVRILKRDPDQRQGTVTSYLCFDARWSRIYKTGEPILQDISSEQSRMLHLPRIELDRLGIEYFFPTDRFEDEQGRFWQPESTTTITVKLMEVHVDIACKSMSRG